MKKILIVLTVMTMSLSNVFAGGHGLRHANSMPNLMRIAMGNAELLNLNKDQVMALKAWSSDKKPQMMMMIKKVMSEEYMLHEEALTGDVNVPKKAEVMLETRRKIIEMKSACREHLRNTLSKKQYSQVIGIYRSTRGKRQNMFMKR